MIKRPFTFALLYCFLLLTGRVFGIGEKIISLGSSDSWNLMEQREGVIEASLIRPEPVLMLSSQAFPVKDDSSLDLYLSFDEREARRITDSYGNYDVFTNELITIRPQKSALFAPGSLIQDFSIEFWLYPLNTEEGEQILSWDASGPNGRGTDVNQQIRCFISRNKLQWRFNNFFLSPGERSPKNMSLSGPHLVPRTWSHHLIRFDADLGLFEYLVDGRLEALDYTTSTGREGSEVFTPVIGEDCRLVLGNRYSGMMDQFRIYSKYLQTPVLAKYSGRSGRAQTYTLDLGNSNSRVLKIEAFGGRTRGLQNEYAGNSILRFDDHAEIRFYLRTSDSPYQWHNIPWVSVKPGADIPAVFLGRYVQLAADFYPSGDGETSPYLTQLKVIYKAAEPPSPPTNVIAFARDGAVELSWRASPTRDVGGYLVYYGTSRGEYFGEKSPIDAGNGTSVRIDGLSNGTLYYFAIASYTRPETDLLYIASESGPVREPGRKVLEPGEFSREAAARPIYCTAEDLE